MRILFRLALCAVLAVAATVSHAQSEYRVRTGDVLNIEVLEDPDLSRSLVVLPDGRISFPRIGTVKARGRTISQITRAITTGIASDFASQPNVFISVSPAEVEAPEPPEPKTISVYFLGEVNTPGGQELEPGITFLQALSQSGGLTQFAAEKRIQLRRTNPKTKAQSLFEIDYRALSRGAFVGHDIPLVDGDVILVPERRLFE